MSTVMGCLPKLEQLKLQVLDKWWYATGVGRVQQGFELLKMFFFADNKAQIIAVNETETGQFMRFKFTGEEPNFTNSGWISCQVWRNRLF